MKQPPVCIVILNYNGLEDTRECLKSVQGISYDSFEVIVIDNGSRQDEAAIIKDEFPGFEIIRQDQNLGFAEGNNVGIRLALERGAQYVFLLNNDTIVAPEILTAFVEAAERNQRAGFFNAKIYYYDDPQRIWFAGARFDEEHVRLAHMDEKKLDDGTVCPTVRETDFTIGCALFVRREVVDAIGMMDERFFLLYEETDWCYRAKQAGFTMLVVTDAKVWHKESVSFGGMFSPIYEYYSVRNRLLWARKSFSSSRRRRFYFTMITRVLFPHLSYNRGAPLLKRLWWDLKMLASACRNERVLTRLMGLRDFLLGKFGECPVAVYRLHQRSRHHRSEQQARVCSSATDHN